MTSPDAPALSIVVPAYNEQEVLPEFHRRLASALADLGLAWEVVYVNDGSRDTTLEVMLGLQAADPRVAVVNLSRNFGKEIALTAGLDHARGTDAVVVIDADLQDPPEVIPELVAGWQEGFDVVYARRNTREGETWLKKATAHAFYRFMQRIGGKVQLPPDTGDFRLLSRRALDALLKLREQHRFMKGLFAWIGFPAKAVRYDRAPRAAGTTKWNYWKLWNFSLEGITSFTVAPLKVATYFGLLTAIGAVIYLAQLVVRTVFFGNPVAGYPSLLAVVLFLGGVQMMMLGIIGEYLGRIFNETKQRPLYFTERYLPSRQASSSPTGTQSAVAPGMVANA
ncbi:glycosyltransferase family 2 protein [Neoroseomonas soli]|uniref:Glycosyltransferase family 2 protein n=1 Tax=Neoroseomonas soli TaxID=1081025 RepID=A0A9X9WWB5_9PROT|nr:glycosyltransferase family 2 protein [Neoroseomonas soli]MBR0671444.1 glycosyltransferase family 2 protein [Neoroseomonas soli]